MKTAVQQAIAVSGLLLAASVGSFAQNIERAQVGFSFRAGQAMFPAGEYELIRDGRSTGTVFFRIKGEGKHTLLVPRYNGTSVRSQPQLTLYCVLGEICSLVEVRNASGTKWSVPSPALTPSQRASSQTVTVAMRTRTAD